MALRLCGAAGRIAFRHQDAEKVIAKLGKVYRGLAAAPLSHYRCLACKRWHVCGMTQAESAEYQRIRGKPEGKPNRKQSLSTVRKTP